MDQRITINSIPLYFRKFLSSVDVKAMTTREVGAYFLLLATSIDQPNPGYLDMDERGLATICKMDTESWKFDRKRVLKKFKHEERGYYNEAMVAAIKEQMDKHSSEKSANLIADIPDKNNFNTIKGDPRHPLQALIEDRFIYIRKMNDQLTYKQCEILIKRHKFSEELIMDKLMLLENTIDPHKKWNSVFITILSWCKRAEKK